MLFPFSSLVEKQVPYLVLQNFKPEENKFRVYLIQLREEQGRYIVDLSRGRMLNFQRRKEEIFDKKSQFLSFLKSTIETRKSHGYRLVDMSLDFPLVQSLWTFEQIVI